MKPVKPKPPKDMVVCPKCRRRGCEMCKGQGQIYRSVAEFYQEVLATLPMTDDKGNPVPPTFIEIEELP
jgi:hypothetical protein